MQRYIQYKDQRSHSHILVAGHHQTVIIQIMLKVFILGYIYAHPAYRDLMRAEGPKHIPIF